MTPRRPRIVAFDVMETMMRLEPLRARFEDAGLPGEALDTWYARTLRDGMALTATGDFQPFRPVAEGALRAVSFSAGRRAGNAPAVLDDAAVEHVLDGLASLPAHLDVDPALRRLAAADVPAVCLTNGAGATTMAFLDHAGLTDLVDRVIGIEEVRRWKPSAAVYAHAAAATGVPADRLALVAAHAWDCHGAKRAGLVTGWVGRLEGRYGDAFAPPDVTGDDLVQVVDGLLTLDR
ncbi:haloacid dehalogenase type II [Actinomadura sp. KC06]|uniref:haloacid dehalogenase type II n=1 Tax=Actinomadura sp. KC06 TaxID=2530369 RepID=UPI001FB7F924|nr:haloacid dehalogenase type II [Actinomadura sp. KC06]